LRTETGGTDDSGRQEKEAVWSYGRWSKKGGATGKTREKAFARAVRLTNSGKSKVLTRRVE